MLRGRNSTSKKQPFALRKSLKISLSIQNNYEDLNNSMQCFSKGDRRREKLPSCASWDSEAGDVKTAHSSIKTIELENFPNSKLMSLGSNENPARSKNVVGASTTEPSTSSSIIDKALITINEEREDGNSETILMNLNAKDEVKDSILMTLNQVENPNSYNVSPSNIDYAKNLSKDEHLLTLDESTNANAFSFVSAEAKRINQQILKNRALYYDDMTTNSEGTRFSRKSISERVERLGSSLTPIRKEIKLSGAKSSVFSSIEMQRVRFIDSGDQHKSEISTKSSASEISRKPSFKNVTCPICHKFYTSRSLEFHYKACLIRMNDEKKEREALESMLKKSINGPSRPPGSLCYICGRRYTNSSYKLHEPKCLEQWHSWNDRLPKCVKRLKDPVKPNINQIILNNKLIEAKNRGNHKYSLEDALDDIMYEASVENALPLEYL